MMNDRSYLPPSMPTPMPSPDGLDADFWAGTRSGELRFQRCDDCGVLRSPEWICHACRSFRASWVAVPQRGSVFTWERVWHPAMPELEESVPYIVVVVELDGTDGLRLLGNLLGDPMQHVAIGDRVEAVFEHHAEHTLVQWRLT